MTNFFHLISTKIATFFAIAIVTVTSILPWHGTNTNKPTDILIATPSAVVSESATLSPSITPTVPKTKNRVETIPTTTPETSETQTQNLPQIKEVQKPKKDSSVSIELCRANATKERLRYEQIADETINKEQPGTVELANASTNEQTEQVALKYGYIKQSDIVRSADIYQKLIAEGEPSDYAKSIAESMGNSWWTYLRSLHDWAVKGVDDFKDKVKIQADNYENEVYQGCLGAL